MDGQPSAWIRYTSTRLVMRLRGWLIASVVLLLPALAMGQITAEIELSETLVAAGQRFSVRIIIDHESVDEVAPPEIPWGPHLGVISGPVVRTVRLPGFSDARVAVDYELVARLPGRVVIEPIELDVAGQVFRTPARLLEISEARDLSRIPVRLEWRASADQLVVGQVVPVTLEVVHAREYVYPESISIAAPAQTIFEEVQGLGAISRRTVDGIELLRIPIAGFMLTAGATGTIRLPAATAVVDGFEVTSEPVVMSVDPLPASAVSTGAVGTFEVEARLERDTVLAGDSVGLEVIVRGIGNLHYLELPDPRVDGVEVTLTDRSSDLTSDPAGYRGEVYYQYSLTPVRSTSPDSDEPETVRVSFERFFWFDPSRGTVRSALISPLLLGVERATAGSSETTQETALALLTYEEVQRANPPNRYRDASAYGWFAPGLLVFLGALIFRRNRSRMLPAAVALVVILTAGVVARADRQLDEISPAEISRRALSAAASGDMDVAIALYVRMLRDEPASPGLIHNVGVLEGRRLRIPEAVFAFREALRINPHLRASRTALSEAEAMANLDRQIAVPHLVVPDVFFFGMAVAANLLFLLLALVPRSSGPRAIALILLSSLWMVSLVGMLVADARAGEGVAVVAEDLDLRRIPDPTAQGWIRLESGAAMEIVTTQGDSVLLRSASGVEGWALRSSLFIQAIDAPWFAAAHPSEL